MQIKIIIRTFIKSISYIGALVLVSWGVQELANKKDACINDKNTLLKMICFSQKVNSKINTELNILTKSLKPLIEEGEINPRGSDLLSKERFKNYNEGFSFSYLKSNGTERGFLLLSRIDPNLMIPKIELWDLTQQKIIHKWEINLDNLIQEININNKDKKVLRFLHPLLLKDGSIITHIQPEHRNTELLKFDYCGNLTKIRANNLGYHHSIEKDDEGNIFVPIARVPKPSKYYSNYEKFSEEYRNEGIAILNNDLEIKEIIALDEIFDSIGLLRHINSSPKSINDPYHLNDVHPFKDKKNNLNLLLSMRHFGLISYNHNNKKVNWVSYGLTDFQHDISPYLDSQSIFTIFDNGDSTNQSLKQHEGNTIIKLDFTKLIDNDEKTIVIFGKSPNLTSVDITRINFKNLDDNLIPNSIYEGRGRFIDQSRIYIEETNFGRAFVYNIDTKKLDWSYYNKGLDGYSRFLSWSRHLENVPQIFKKENICQK